MDSHDDFLADEATVDRVDVPLHVDRAAGPDLDVDSLGSIETVRRKASEDLAFLLETLLPTRIELSKQMSKELLVLPAAHEVPAASQE